MEQQRHRPQASIPSPPETPDAGGGSSANELDATRAQGSALLAASSSIITAALSGNSQAFLAANRQSGGQ